MLTEHLSREVAAIAEDLRRITVQVQEHRRGNGSGVIWNRDGVIITNAHVVTGNHAQVELFDGRKLTATVIARNIQRDLVALQTNTADLPGAIVGNSDTVRVGELVLAVGNPLGQVGALTTGIIHNLGSDQFNHRSWLQADIRLAPGNSGGPLANAHGEVIGINTMIVNGRGFAVPSQVVQRFLSATEDRPYLGVSIQPIRIPTRRRRAAFGLLVTAVITHSPAETAGLQPGDILMGVRGSAFQRPDELFRILENSSVGDSLPLDVLRGNRSIVASVVLCSQDSETQAA
jgi:serine protease Do